MSFLGIVGSRHGPALSASSQEPDFSLFVTLGLTTFCHVPERGWRGNDNAGRRGAMLSLVPSAD